MYCTNCSAENRDAARFCIECGQPLSVARRRWPKWLIGLGIVAVVAIVAVVVLRQWLRVGTNEAIKLMPADTLVMLSICPNPTQLQQLQKLQGLAGVLAGAGDLGDISYTLSEELDIDFERDVLPWAGLEFAVGVVPSEYGEPGFILAAATRNSTASTAFVSKVKHNLEEFEGLRFREENYAGIDVTYETGGDLAYAEVNRFLVVTYPAQLVYDCIDAAREDRTSLAMSDSYQNLMRELPRSRDGYMYVDWSALSRALGVLDEFPFSALRAVDSVGASLDLSSDGARFDFVVIHDSDLMSTAQMNALRRTPNPNTALAMAPADCLAYFGGQGLVTAFDQPLIAASVGADNLEEVMGELSYALGIDIERDVLSWADGEYAVAILEDPYGLMGDEDTPLALVIMIEATDRSAAERAMRLVRNTLEQYMNVQEETISGRIFHTVTEPYSDLMLGYGFIDDFLVIGTSRRALTSVAQAGNLPLARDATFRKATSQLPSRNGGYVFINLKRGMDAVYRQMSSWDQMDFDENVRPYIEPLRAIGLANELSGDEDVSHGAVSILFEPED